MSEAPQHVKIQCEERRSLLVGSIKCVLNKIDFCPHATTLKAYSRVLQTEIICQIKCKRWGCSHCGPRKVQSMALRVKEAKPQRLITLTVDPKLYETPRIAYDKTRRKVTELAARLRRKYESFEYIRILEVTRAGWPHYHLVARSPYIPHQILKNIWAEITGAIIVDVRALKKTDHVYFYVLKYLAKQTYIPWTTRRISWSRHFFPKHSEPKGMPLKLSDRELCREHPSEIISLKWTNQVIVQFTRDVFIIAVDHESAQMNLNAFQKEQL